MPTLNVGAATHNLNKGHILLSAGFEFKRV